jgi:hypothetical protein
MVKATEAEARGTASDATVSNVPPDAEARKALLASAEAMPEGPARNRVLELADSLITPAERELQLAEECEAAAESIAEKIKGMEATRETKLAEAEEHRANADKAEGE